MLLEGEAYYIQSKSSGKQVDVDNSRTENGTNIHLWTLNKTNAQKKSNKKWRILFFFNALQ